jgi:hypothetical protein
MDLAYPSGAHLRTPPLRPADDGLEREKQVVIGDAGRGTRGRA